MESFRLPTLPARTVARGFRTGASVTSRVAAAGKGTVLALPHLGGWEWAGRWMVDQGYELTVVVEPVEPPELFEWFVELREASA